MKCDKCGAALSPEAIGASHRYCDIQCANNSGATMTGDTQMFCPHCHKRLANEKAVRHHMRAKHGP